MSRNLRIDSCTKKLLATHEPPMGPRQEWYRENADHVMMEVKGCVIHVTITPTKGKSTHTTIRAQSNADAMRAVSEVAIKDMIR